MPIVKIRSLNRVIVQWSVVQGKCTTPFEMSSACTVITERQVCIETSGRRVDCGEEEWKRVEGHIG